MFLYTYWLPRGFPKQCPLVYVSLGPGLAMSSVNYVDADGKINIPYLTAWKEVCHENPIELSLLCIA